MRIDKMIREVSGWLRVVILSGLWGAIGFYLPHVHLLAWIQDSSFIDSPWLTPFIFLLGVIVAISWPHLIMSAFAKNTTLSEFLNPTGFDGTSPITAIFYIFVVLVYYQVKKIFFRGSTIAAIVGCFCAIFAYIAGYLVVIIIPFFVRPAWA